MSKLIFVQQGNGEFVFDANDISTVHYEKSNPAHKIYYDELEVRLRNGIVIRCKGDTAQCVYETIQAARPPDLSVNVADMGLTLGDYFG